MSENHREILNGLIQRRDDARDNVSRIKGRLEEARAELAGVQEECAKRKVAPEKLGEAIISLEGRLDQNLEEMEAGIQAAEAAVQPFLSEETE